MSVHVESIFELQRVVNKDFGFLIEIARSDFPTRGLSLPAKPWLTSRVSIDMKNIWLPIGGGAAGTILIAVSRVEAGVPIPESILRFVLQTLSGNCLANLRNGSTLAGMEGSPWHERLRQDADGFYAELAEVEAIAAKRREVSVRSLPGPEIFERPWRLS